MNRENNEENFALEQENSTNTVNTKTHKVVEKDFSKKIFPLIMFSVGVLIMLLQWIIGLNKIALCGIIYMIFSSVCIAVGVIFKKKLYLWELLGYLCVSFGIATYFIINGADAGWGAITSGLTGFDSASNALWQGKGNFGTRLLGNIIICAPAFLLLLALYLLVDKIKADHGTLKNALTSGVSVLLVVMSVVFVFTCNLRSKPRVFNLRDGEKEYLNNINKNANSNSPNVLVILMDDLGYGDTSYNARKANMTPAFETPNIDRIAEEGLDFDNFYSSYSVCSPARFALMTGRYPYRGYADNVMYPTVNSFNPVATTRVFNSIELGANCDGMLGDEVTMAESFKAAGYKTGCFGKWHLGDYGDYLPTNQGFDYFYGSHHVNDMVPFYHSEEENGEYKIAVGTDKLDQSEATKLIHDKTYSWIEDRADSKEPFFAYYATPWPHAPVYAGYDFQGKSGAGIYGDCVTEFDHHLGLLFNMMEEKGILDDTIIVFTSDNGPALQGSTNEMRGGKYSPYDGGQKLPFYIRWGNNETFKQRVNEGNQTIEAHATLADLYPTLTNMCNITNGDIRGYMPSDVDREIDGVNMLPLIDGSKEYIHDKEHPILHMKREGLKAIQYTMSTEEVLATTKGYESSTDHKLQMGNEGDYLEMPFIKNNDNLTWKYFKRFHNDNPEFPDKVRKNWLICLTDDTSESYQRADVFPDLALEYRNTLDEWSKKLKNNRRGVYSSYYKK